MHDDGGEGNSKQNIAKFDQKSKSAESAYRAVDEGEKKNCSRQNPFLCNQIKDYSEKMSPQPHQMWTTSEGSDPCCTLILASSILLYQNFSHGTVKIVFKSV